MDTALPQKNPFILDRNLAKANCTENHVCTSCDKVVLDIDISIIVPYQLLYRINYCTVLYRMYNDVVHYSSVKICQLDHIAL